MASPVFSNFRVIALGVGVLFSASITHANSTTSFLIPNSGLDEEGGVVLPITGGDDHWTFPEPWGETWFHDFSRATFYTSPNNLPGTYSATVDPVDLTAEPNVTSLPGYDPATTKLTNLTFFDPWRSSHWGIVPAPGDGDYNYFLEFTIDTPGGQYKAATQKLNNPFENTSAQLGFVFTWQGGSYLGDPFAGGGLPLADITDMNYEVFMEVITPTAGGDGWFGVEFFDVDYEVTSASLNGDLNGDGFVGIDDLNIVLGAWNQNVPPANPLADPSGDGFVGIDDLNTVLGNWNAGTPPTNTSNVPEPSALGVFAIGGLAALRRYRKR